MKRIILVILISSLCSEVFCSNSIEQRIAKLEQTVKAQSDSLAIYKAKVADVEKQKNFLSDIYNGNASWAMLLLSIISSFLVLSSGYSVITNISQVKKIKNELKKEVESVEDKFKDELLKTKNDLLGNTFEDRADIARLFVREATRNADLSFAILLYLNAIEFDLKYVKYKGSHIISILNNFYNDISQIEFYIVRAKQDKKKFNSQLDFLNKKIVEIIELCNKFTDKSDELNLIISEITKIKSLLIRQVE